MTFTSNPTLKTGHLELLEYGVIEVSGEDSATFLHNQLTHDFLHLSTHQVRFCAFCNAKGRVQASFYAVKVSDHRFLLILSADLLDQTLKRLSMFVLRSKVKIKDASTEITLTGYIGDEYRPSNLGDKTLECLSNGTEEAFSIWISLAKVGSNYRFLHIMSKLPEGVQSGHQQGVLSSNEWLLGEVLSGQCLINLATFEAFVPQMINYESLDGIHFQKGCYPGQEVVARSQYRGTIKRRGYIISTPSKLSAGELLFDPSDLEQPIGQVVQVATHLETTYAFASIQTAHVGQTADQIKILTTRGDIAVHTLAYPLREDI